MIEGLKVTIGAAELQKLCRDRAEHHRERVTAYRKQVQAMQADRIQPMGYTGGDPIKALSDKAVEHQGEADELAFIAEHLTPGETYTLDRRDLHRLGIAQSHY